MKKNEIIKLNNVEYTVELNRDSFLKIDQYSNIQKSMEKVNEDLYEYKKDIKDDEDPFAEEIKLDDLEKKGIEKLEVLKSIIVKAFWIWLYPNHKLSINEVKQIIEPYFEEGKEEEQKFISEKYGEFLQKSVDVRESYVKEQKKLRSLANK